MLAAAIDPDTKFCQGQAHIATPIGDATAMMSIARGSYYAVSGVAERIWQLLQQPITPREIAERLQSEYDVDPANCECEVNGFLRELLAEGLVEQCEG